MDEKVQYVFPEVLKYRETKEAAAQTAAEAKRRGMTVSEFVRASMRETLGLPPAPTIERKQSKLGAETGAKARPTPAIPEEIRRTVLEHFESRLSDIKSRIHGGGITEARYREMAWDDLAAGLRGARFEERDAWLAAVAAVRKEEAGQ